MTEWESLIDVAEDAVDVDLGDGDADGASSGGTGTGDSRRYATVTGYVRASFVLGTAFSAMEMEATRIQDLINAGMDSGTFSVNARYFSLVVYNQSGASLTNDTAENWVYVSPVPDEIQ